MTDYRCMFSTSDRHHELHQLCWQNMSAHLTNETSYWLKKLLMHLNWTIYDVCNLNIDPHVCFFPTLSQDRAWPVPLAQPEACPQRSERPVCTRSPHRSRNGHLGCMRFRSVSWVLRRCSLCTDVMNPWTFFAYVIFQINLLGLLQKLGILLVWTVLSNLSNFQILVLIC